MAKAKADRIFIKSNGTVYDEAPLEAPDVYGDGVITPGMLVELNSDGNVIPHATQGGNASPHFAVENAILGDGIDVDYEDEGETVLIGKANTGDVVNALLAAGQDISIGELLQSAGNGYLEVYSSSTPPPLRPVARAIEAIDNDPGTGGAAVRILVEVV